MESKFYHILNRGVEKRKIFLDKEDYLRFVDNFQDFNNFKNVLSYRDRRSPEIRFQGRKEVVDIFYWCLISNHVHCFVQEKIDGGVSKFSQKLFLGYTKYFNLKYNRSGVLFQGRTKIVPVERNEHFLWLPFYIMANPIKLIEPKWKEDGIKNFKKVMEFLENYKYSSYSDLIGKNNFPEIFNKKLFYEIYDTDEKRFKKDFTEWLKNIKGSLKSFEN